MQSYKDYTNEFIIINLYRNLTNESIETSQFYEMVRNDEVLLNILEHGYITEDVLSKYTRTCFGFGEFKSIYDLFEYGLAIYGSRLNDPDHIGDVNISDELMMNQWSPKGESLEKYIKIVFDHFNLNSDECFVVLPQRTITRYELFNMAYKQVHKEPWICKLIIKNDHDAEECMLINEAKIKTLKTCVDIQNTQIKRYQSDILTLKHEVDKYKPELATLKHEHKKDKSELATLKKELNALQKIIDYQKIEYVKNNGSWECKYRRLTRYLRNHGWADARILEIEADP